MKPIQIRNSLFILVLTSVSIYVCYSRGATPVVNSEGLSYVGADSRAFVPAHVAQGWADGFEDDKIADHAWHLWAAINQLTDQYSQAGPVKVNMPAWETWFDETEIFGQPSDDSAKLSHYHVPRQIANSNPASPVISFNKFSLEFKTWVSANKFNDENTLIALNKKFDQENAPLGKRFVDTSTLNPHAVMLKPTFFVIKPDRPSPMQYWKGPGMLNVTGTREPKVPTAATWTQIVVIDPTNKAKPGVPYTLKVKGPDDEKNQTFTDYQIVGLDRFFYVPLTKADIKWIQAGNVFIVGGISPNQLAEGDLALLVAMHVTTAEFSDWTWQTFWWTPEPLAKAPSFVPAPFNNYDMATSYYMLNRDRTPHIVQNPFLEPPDQGPIFMNASDVGVKSSCMSCHHAAAYPTMNREPNPGTMLNGSYIATGQVTGNEFYFQNRVKTIFMWSMVTQLQAQNKLQKGLQTPPNPTTN